MKSGGRKVSSWFPCADLQIWLFSHAPVHGDFDADTTPPESPDFDAPSPTLALPIWSSEQDLSKQVALALVSSSLQFAIASRGSFKGFMRFLLQDLGVFRVFFSASVLLP